MPTVNFNFTVPMAGGLVGGATGFYIGHKFDREMQGGIIPIPSGRLFGTIFGFAGGYTLGSGVEHVLHWINTRERRHKGAFNLSQDRKK